jgi:uncharacterized protein YndB with AHSA1/START domain
MLAVIEQLDNGYTARFERHMRHSVEEVWSYFTDNDKLPLWFPELLVDDLREGGLIKFDMQDGTFEELIILELKMHSVLEFTWGEDIVRFELTEDSEGCKLVLNEKLKEITNHTPKDLAGWHVCLDVINTLLDGRQIASREDDWKKWYDKYTEEIKKISQ